MKSGYRKEVFTVPGTHSGNRLNGLLVRGIRPYIRGGSSFRQPTGTTGRIRKGLGEIQQPAAHAICARATSSVAPTQFPSQISISQHTPALQVVEFTEQAAALRSQNAPILPQHYSTNKQPFTPMNPDKFESDEAFEAAYRRLSTDQRAALKTILIQDTQPRADELTGPHRHAAETLGKVFNLEPDALMISLAASAAAINGGSLSGLEGTLATQATTLNALFHRLTQVSMEKPRSAEEFATYFKLALRAQAQSAKALEILGDLKQGPRVVITGQLNTANQQVVHNGPEIGELAKGQNASMQRKAKPRRRAFAKPSNSMDNMMASNSQPAPQYATLD